MHLRVYVSHLLTSFNIAGLLIPTEEENALRGIMSKTGTRTIKCFMAHHAWNLTSFPIFLLFFLKIANCRNISLSILASSFQTV